MSKPLTDWEVANELVSISDYMAERIADFRLTHPEVFVFVQERRLQIGDYFNRMNTHGFGIASHDNEKNVRHRDAVIAKQAKAIEVLKACILKEDKRCGIWHDGRKAIEQAESIERGEA